MYFFRGQYWKKEHVMTLTLNSGSRQCRKLTARRSTVTSFTQQNHLGNSGSQTINTSNNFNFIFHYHCQGLTSWPLNKFGGGLESQSIFILHLSNVNLYLLSNQWKQGNFRLPTPPPFQAAPQFSTKRIGPECTAKVIFEMSYKPWLYCLSHFDVPNV